MEISLYTWSILSALVGSALGQAPGLDEVSSDPSAIDTSASTDSGVSEPDVSTYAAAFPIVDGYVAFGDSFAAGMGTGTTTGDACRVGENSYPKLLNEYGKTPTSDFQNLPCSGDTVVGLMSQIDKWITPEKADVATISIGGNDVGFSKIVIACVTQTKTGFFSGDCQTEMTNAQNLLNNRDGDDSLFNQIVAAYVAIKNKSVKSSFHAYVTGYPAFFNVDTELCNDVTYYYLPPWWNPGYHPNHDYGDPSLYLTQDKRLGLNNLLQSLNGFLQDAVNTANGQIGSQVFTFVDTNAPFDGHRWCENDGGDDVQEPQPNRAATWFFLSNWKDFPVDPEALSATDDSNNQEVADLATIIQAGSYTLPDQDTCETAMADPSGIDPYLLHQCAFSGAVSTGEPYAVDILQGINDDIAAGNYSSQHIPWILPTRQIKTFHPRSTGQFMMRGAVISAWNQVGAASSSTSAPSCTLGDNSACQSMTCPSGSSGQCTEDEGTGGGMCQCLTVITPTSSPDPPSTPSATPSATPSPTSTACQGNQVQGDCTQATLPSAAPFSGPQAPVCQKYDGTDKPRVNAEQAAQAAANLCAQLISDGTVLAASSSSLAPAIIPNAAENGGSAVLAVLYYQTACPTDQSTSVLDFTAIGQDECVQNFYGSMEAYCSETEGPADYNADFTIEGGTLGNDCGLFSLYGQPAS